MVRIWRIVRSGPPCRLTRCVLTSPEPTPPAGHDPPKPIDVGLSLIKPAGTLAQAALAFVGWPKGAAGMELIAEKIKTTGQLSDEAFFGV